MSQRKSDCRWVQACPAFLSIAKSAEAEKAGATQHSAKQFSQSACRLRPSPGGASFPYSRFSDNVRGLQSKCHKLYSCILCSTISIVGIPSMPGFSTEKEAVQLA